METAKYTSLDVGTAALEIAITVRRDEENVVKQFLEKQGILSTLLSFFNIFQV